ncbi:hypothetical protein FHS27_004312 [Rhodopirellula rubra]|uniref:Uncharacterized protein n=1 Tax=Aporhodopirellula rubra TaxID=980271 RepID=A0A7W5E2N3_9BACT|nr:hypothetical protein [Aporhodopirellula rubra]MBB3208483.1 hypothetical protein [Aporhodopirellula rubra]
MRWLFRLVLKQSTRVRETDHCVHSDLIRIRQLADMLDQLEDARDIRTEHIDSLREKLKC